MTTLYDKLATVMQLLVDEAVREISRINEERTAVSEMACIVVNDSEPRSRSVQEPEVKLLCWLVIYI